ncbi:Uncharacterised protein [Serratia liquefaciens]|nr:Uncharacterised protein [Serratia quinivorans]CAI1085353.1 Uncharacterised protein [Serratia quinivorans]CAI2122562.1 Uncharacterised protein [Serratia quinivorans]CAI2489654.1 Uncharacterised protein [Serratia liquefaciens]
MRPLMLCMLMAINRLRLPALRRRSNYLNRADERYASDGEWRCGSDVSRGGIKKARRMDGQKEDLHIF